MQKKELIDNLKEFLTYESFKRKSKPEEDPGKHLEGRELTFLEYPGPFSHLLDYRTDDDGTLREMAETFLEAGNLENEIEAMEQIESGFRNLAREAFEHPDLLKGFKNEDRLDFQSGNSYDIEEYEEVVAYNAMTAILGTKLQDRELVHAS